MTSTNSDWSLGETRGPIRKTIDCLAKTALKAGDFVSLNGTTGGYSGLAQVKKHSGKVAVFGVSLYDAADESICTILVEGVVKVTFGDTIAGDRAVHVKDNKAVGASSNASATCAWLVSGAKANNETGIVYLNARPVPDTA